MDKNDTFLTELKEEIQADIVTLFDADTKPYIVATWGDLQLRYSYNLEYYIEDNFVDIVADSLLWGKRMVEKYMEENENPDTKTRNHDR